MNAKTEKEQYEWHELSVQKKRTTEKKHIKQKAAAVIRSVSKWEEKNKIDKMDKKMYMKIFPTIPN